MVIGYSGREITERLRKAAAAHRRKTERARRVDEARTADEVVGDPREWEPERNDLRGVDHPNADLEGADERPSKAERIASVDHADYAGDSPGTGHDPSPDEGAAETAVRLSGIAPVMGNPSLDPGNPSLVEVSYMAGFGAEAAVGHDAMQGVDALALGEADANRELEVGSATEGGPLELADDESIMRGEASEMAMSPDDGEYPCYDWCSELALHEGEAPEGGWL